MANVISAFGDFFKSIYELVAAFVMSFYNLIQSLLSAVGTFFAEIFHLVSSAINGAFSVVGETGNFLISNLLVIALVGAGVFGYLRYQKNRGQPVVVGGKKLN